MSKTLAVRFKESLLGGEKVIVFQAHAALSAGDNVLITTATGISLAGGATTTAAINAVVLEAVTGAGVEGRAMLVGSDNAAQAVGSLL